MWGYTVFLQLNTTEEKSVGYTVFLHLNEGRKVVVGRMQSHSEVCSFHQTFEWNFNGSSNATPVCHAHYYATAFARAIATCLVHYGEQ